MSPRPRHQEHPALRVVLDSWSGFLTVGVFSLFVNFGALLSPIYMQQVFDRVLQSRHLETLVYLSLLIIGLLALVAVLDGVRGALLARISRWWDEVVQAELFSAIVRTAQSKGIVQTQVMNDLGSIRQFVGGPSILPFFDGPWMPVFLTAIALVHPWLGIVAACAAAMLFVIAALNDIVTRRQMEGLGGIQARAQTLLDLAARHADSVMSMGMLPGILKRFRSDGDHVAETTYQVGAFTAVVGAFSRFVRFTAQIAVLGLGAYLATTGEITGGAMIAASIIMGRALAPADQALGAWRTFVAARHAQRRITEVLSAAATAPEKSLQPAPVGRVDFDGVTLMLPGMERPLLRAIDLKIEPAQVVAIVGSSGAGKSMFCKLLVGALNPSAGSVRLDGVAMANWSEDQFAKVVGYLPQTVQLMDGTVAENIARMRTPDSAAVLEAARLAGCHDLINRLPKGYDTPIGAGGITLSGGQAQRIGLARALYGNPRLLVLDEPNANLDGEGDAALQQALKRMSELGSTIFIVSHRPTSLTHVDLIVTIENGVIARKQTREEFFRAAVAPVEEIFRRLRPRAPSGAGPASVALTVQDEEKDS